MDQRGREAYNRIREVIEDETARLNDDVCVEVLQAVIADAENKMDECE